MGLPRARPACVAALALLLLVVAPLAPHAAAQQPPPQQQQDKQQQPQQPLEGVLLPELPGPQPQPPQEPPPEDSQRPLGADGSGSSGGGSSSGEATEAAAADGDEAPVKPAAGNTSSQQDNDTGMGWIVVYRTSSVARTRAAGVSAQSAAAPQIMGPSLAVTTLPDLPDSPNGGATTAAASAQQRVVRPAAADALLRATRRTPTASLVVGGNLAVDVFADEATARMLQRRTRDVAYVERDSRVSLFQYPTATQGAANTTGYWGLDRIDQRGRALSNSYVYYTDAGSGADVDVYVLDTGVRQTHSEFGGRAQNLRNYYPGGLDNCDMNGHGTHVSATIGGSNAGVAKRVNIYGIKVLDNQGFGKMSSIIDGINFVVSRAKRSRRRSIISMSLGGRPSRATNRAVENAFAHGVIVVVAAGNDDRDAANYSPASAPSAVTVGATNAMDAKAAWSNHGPLVDMHAPGVDIKSAWWRTDTDTKTISGTSMATPHVAGVIATIWSACSSCTPQAVVDQMVAYSTKNVVTGLPVTTVNRLVFSRFTTGP